MRRGEGPGVLPYSPTGHLSWRLSGDVPLLSGVTGSVNSGDKRPPVTQDLSQTTIMTVSGPPRPFGVVQTWGVDREGGESFESVNGVLGSTKNGR